jgi:tetratricopeptide (TPR) repeat protein
VFRSHFVIAALLVVAGGDFSPTKASAQEFVTQRLLVHTFEGPRGDLGRRAGDEVSNAIDDGHKGQNLIVVERDEMLRQLEKSGFNTDTVLMASEMRDMTRRYRADEYVVGRVYAANGRAVRLEGMLMLTRDSGQGQPISTAVLPDLKLASEAFAAEVLRARAQLAPVRRCENAMRAGKVADAASSALEGIRAYPRATMARVCLLRAYAASGKGADTILAVAKAVLAIDSTNTYGLEASALAYDDLGDREEAGRAWAALAVVSAKVPDALGNIVAALMRDGNPRIAKPIITEAVAARPDDEHLAGLNWHVLLATEDWDAATKAGEALRKTSPLYETQPDFFVRMATAYKNAGRPVQALATASEGVTRIPDDPDLYLLFTQLVLSESDSAIPRGLQQFPKSGKLLALDAQNKRKHGDLQGALEATRHAVQQDTTLTRGYLQLAQAYLDVDQTDSALAVLGSGLHRASDTLVVGQFTLARGNVMYRAANASKKREDFEKAFRFLSFSNQIAPSQNAGFLMGSAAFGVAQLAAAELPTTKSCPIATIAQDNLIIAETRLATNGGVAPDAAKQFLDYAAQLQPYVDQQMKTLCVGTPGHAPGTP